MGKGKFITGIVLLSIYALIVFGAVSKPDGDSSAAIGGGLFLIAAPGALLTYFGRKRMVTGQRVVEFALQLWHKDKRIDAARLAQGLGLTELVVRRTLAEARQQNLIPFEAEVA